MSEAVGPPLDVREQIARTDRLISVNGKLLEESQKPSAESHRLNIESQKLAAEAWEFAFKGQKLAAESQKFAFEGQKLDADRRKSERDRMLTPWQIVLTCMGATVTLVKVLAP